jgi:hypothetical protein
VRESITQDHRAKREARYVPIFSAAMMDELERREMSDTLMGRLGYDANQTKLA